MNILITGGSGFIGRHIAAALHDHGHNISMCSRKASTAVQNNNGLRFIQADFAELTDKHDWLPLLDNIDVVINAVGIIAETGKQTFHNIHTEAPCALFAACEQAGVKRVIQISALGADEHAFSHYHISKHKADIFLQQRDLNWIILQPSLVYGHGATSMGLFRALAALPVTPLPGNGQQLLQPVHISDVVRAIIKTIEPSFPCKTVIKLVGPEAVSMDAMLASLRHWLGLGKARIIHIPQRLAELVSVIAGKLGSRLLSRDNLKMLQQGNTANVKPFVNQMGFMPLDMKTALALHPAVLSDQLHAGLYFFKPVIRLSIAFVWIMAAITSAFLYPLEQSYAMLAAAGIPDDLQPAMLYGAAAMDFILGVALLFNYRTAINGLIQITVILFYTVVISLSQPELWLHPFGMISKNIPLIVMTMIMIVMDRKASWTT